MTLPATVPSYNTQSAHTNKGVTNLSHGVSGPMQTSKTQAGYAVKHVEIDAVSISGCACVRKCTTLN